MDKLKAEEGQSKDIVSENMEMLKQIFPAVFTEGKVDFDALRAELGEYAEDLEERYRFTWNGKAMARRIAQTPSSGTLRPCPKESVDWENTQNLFIEGDNLEVLKLLQKSYHKKVKMIYIDPPYNTGKEFIYPDRYQDNLDTYLAYTGQKDAEGRKFSTNTETSGRFHTNWLNMMYPRLKLARNLLRDDGVIFISIDDNEVNNTLKICDEIFGEENRLGIITVVSNLKGRSDDKYFATAHNFLISYKKGDFETKGIPIPDDYLKDYPETDSEGNKYRLLGLRKRGAGSKREDRPNMFFPIYANPETGKVFGKVSDYYSIEIYPKLSDNTDGRWRWGKDTVKKRIDELISKPVGSEKRFDVFQIDYAQGEDGLKRIKPKTIWTGSGFSNEAGTLEIKKLFGAKIFDNPKPSALIKYCLDQSTNKDDLVLDYFSGSSTTAQAVIDFNNEDDSNRKFIMIQLPEPCDEKSEAFKAGYKTIADIGKERIRRVIQKIKEEQNTQNQLPCMSEKNNPPDLGFKVFKLDSSNIKAWDPDIDRLEDSLLDAVNNIKADRTEDDILCEILLKYGLDLTVPMEKRNIAEKTVYSIGTGALIICLDADITLDTVEGIAKLKQELQPEIMRVVFRDTGFKDDVVKTNAMQILKQYGIDDVKSL